MATIFSSEQELLDSLKRGGWQIVGKNPHMKDETFTDENRVTQHRQVPTGNVVWSIVGPDGDPDEVVVGISGTGGPSSDYRYSVVEGPKKAIPAAAKPAPDWQSQGEWQIQPDGSKVFKGYNPATKAWEPIPGVAAVPASDKDKPEPKTYEQNGVVYERQSDGTWAPAKGIPAQPQKAEVPVFKEFEGKIYQWVPDASKPGGGTLKLAEGLEQGSHPPGYFIEGGYKVFKNWNEGTKKYEVDPSVQPEAWSPEAQAQAAKTASQPKEGDTRPNISGGFKVTQTYRGGEWTTTEVGERATPRDIQTLTPSTDAPFIVQTDEQGKPVEIRNPNYQGPKAPTTRVELAQRVSFLQTQAQQMRDRIAADKSIPPDQQAARFNQWYDQNVAPQAGALEQQQQAIARDEAQKAMTAAATAISTTAPFRVGPNFASSFEQGLNRLANVHGGGKTPLDFTGSVGWKGPSIDQAVQQTLAPPPGMDFQSLLNRNQWAPGGGPAAAGGAIPAAAAAGPTPEQRAAIAAAGQQTAAATSAANAPFGAIGASPLLAAMQARGGVPDPNAALRARQAADAALQARQAQVGQPVPQQAPPLPSAPPMPLATGSGPLPYSTSTWRPPVPPAPPVPTTGAPGQPYGLVPDAAAPFAGLVPYLNGYDPTQVQTQWDWPHLTPG